MTAKLVNYESLIGALNTEVTALRVLYEGLQKEQNTQAGHIERFDRILVRGDDNHLPLAEIVRNLTTTVGEYITQKDKEEQVRKDTEKKEAAASRETWRKIIVGLTLTAIPAVATFLYQAFVFFYRVVPILDKLQP